MLDMSRDVQAVTGAHFFFTPLFKLQPGSALEQQYEFILLLVIPVGGMAFGHDALDVDGFTLREGFDELFGEFARDVVEEIFHARSIRSLASLDLPNRYRRVTFGSHGSALLPQ